VHRNVIHTHTHTHTHTHIYNASLDARQTRKRDRGYESTREGVKGLSIFIVFYLPILFLIEKRGFTRASWGGHVILGYCDYI
jgi:hypothetical protein